MYITMDISQMKICTVHYLSQLQSISTIKKKSQGKILTGLNSFALGFNLDFLKKMKQTFL